MKEIKWGIIGCGDVTELKSGPAFDKVENSSLVAVMRRDAAKAADYAKRHDVPRWYSDADALISDPEVNAIYIATPPSSHTALALRSLAAGKPVYVEKPMSTDAACAKEMADFANDHHVKLSVAHYRREQPKFKKLQQLLTDKVVGDIQFVQLKYFRKPLSETEMAVSKNAWRIDAEIAGGGLFHDIAPHQLDLMLHYFGDAEKTTGIARNQSGVYDVADLVNGQILFKSGAVFNGTWCFAAAPEVEKDEIEIFGTTGKIIFSVFTENTITVSNHQGTQIYSFDELQHVQQPMIAAVVNYFLDQEKNPCPAAEAVVVMEWIDSFTK